VSRLILAFAVVVLAQPVFALATLAPSPVVELNRAVAIAMADGPEAGLTRLAALAGDDRLAGYPYFHAARADLLRRLGRWSDAADSYRIALEQTSNEVERAFLARRVAEMDRVIALPT
jgi:RNA polymerase sigma-70 factor (ECF subfamily)